MAFRTTITKVSVISNTIHGRHSDIGNRVEGEGSSAFWLLLSQVLLLRPLDIALSLYKSPEKVQILGGVTKVLYAAGFQFGRLVEQFLSATLWQLGCLVSPRWVSSHRAFSCFIFLEAANSLKTAANKRRFSYSYFWKLGKLFPPALIGGNSNVFPQP